MSVCLLQFRKQLVQIYKIRNEMDHLGDEKDEPTTFSSLIISLMEWNIFAHQLDLNQIHIVLWMIYIN